MLISFDGWHKVNWWQFPDALNADMRVTVTLNSETQADH